MPGAASQGLSLKGFIGRELAQDMFLHLAGGGAGNGLDEEDAGRTFEGGEPCRTMAGDLITRCHGTRPQHDIGDAAFSQQDFVKADELRVEDIVINCEC